MLNAIIVLLHDLARWILTLYARWREQLEPPGSPEREWCAVDDSWPTIEPAQIVLFLFAQHVAEMGFWLPVIASWTPAPDASTALTEMSRLRRTGDLDAICALPIRAAEGYRYLVRCDVGDVTRTEVLDDLEADTCQRSLRGLLGAPDDGLRRVSPQRFRAGGEVVTAGDEIEALRDGAWVRGRLVVVDGMPRLHDGVAQRPLSVQSRVRAVPAPAVSPDAGSQPDRVAPALDVTHVFGIVRRVSRETTYDTLHGRRLYSGDRIDVRLPGGLIVAGRYWWDHDRERPAYVDSDTRRIPLSPATPVRRREAPRG